LFFYPLFFFLCCMNQSRFSRVFPAFSSAEKGMFSNMYFTQILEGYMPSSYEATKCLKKIILRAWVTYEILNIAQTLHSICSVFFSLKIV
jgi:hypothetical protein